MTNTAKPPSQRTRLVELDVLRLVAALAVVLYHFQSKLRADLVVMNSPWVELPARFGYLGVDLFFLISGYVIIMSAAGRTARSFLVHRVIRLYPSFWIALAITVVAITSTLPPDKHPSAIRVAANITMLPGYLGQPQIDDVYWTLAVEWKFYVLVAVLLALGLKDRMEQLVYAWIVLLAAQALAIDSGVLRSLTIFPYGAYFAVGILLFLTREHGLDAKRSGALLAGSCLCLFAAARAMPGFIPEPRPGDRLIVLALVAVMLVAFVSIVLRTRQIPPTPRLQMLGSITFPLYLVHNEFGVALFREWNPFTDRTASIGASIAVVFLLAVLMAWAIEMRLVPIIARSKAARLLAGERKPNP